MSKLKTWMHRCSIDVQVDAFPDLNTQCFYGRIQRSEKVTSIPTGKIAFVHQPRVEYCETVKHLLRCNLCDSGDVASSSCQPRNEGTMGRVWRMKMTRCGLCLCEHWHAMQRYIAYLDHILGPGISLGLRYPCIFAILEFSTLHWSQSAQFLGEFRCNFMFTI